MPVYRKLLPAEIEQLKAFAAREGRRWKDTLRYEYWYRGLPVPDFPLVYGLRNSHGPTWLTNLRLNKLG